MKWNPRELKKEDPLVWWNAHHKDFKNVWQVAERYLTIPATSAPSERAFSSAENLVTMRRCRLKHQLVDAMVLFRENIDIFDEMLKNKKIS